MLLNYSAIVRERKTKPGADPGISSVEEGLGGGGPNFAQYVETV